MLVQLRTAHTLTHPNHTVALETEEVWFETSRGNREQGYVAEVDSLDEVYEASREGRIVVRNPTLHDYDEANLVVVEYDYYIES